MENKKYIYDKKIFKVTNYIWWFFFGNLCFILTSILFLITMIAYGEKILSEGFLYMYISSLTLGPSFGAITSVMCKLHKERDVEIFKDYFSGYFKNFKQAFLIWFILDSILFYILMDISLFSVIGSSKMLVALFYSIGNYKKSKSVDNSMNLEKLIVHGVDFFT